MSIVERIEEFIIGKKIATTKDFAAEYRDLLLRDEFTDKVCLGIIIESGKAAKFHTVNFTKNPGALFAGRMGSGKSYSMLFTLATWLANNGHHTIIFMIDPKKGMNDYAPLFDGDLYGMRSDDRPFKQVYTCFSNEDKIHKAIDLCFSEISAREKLFNHIRATSVQEYEKLLEDDAVYERLTKAFPGKKIPRKIPRIFMAFEEFHEIPVLLDFDNNVKKPGTTAKKLASIGKVGRTYGVWFLIATQRAFQSDIPSMIKSSIANQMIHKVLPNEASYLKVEGAAAIDSNAKGRCFCEEGEVQFPYFGVEGEGKENLANMLKHMVKPLTAEGAYLTDKIITEYLSGRTSEDLYDAKNSEELVESIETLDTEIVLSLIHKRMGYTVLRRNYRTDEHSVCHIIKHEGKRIAVTFVDGKKIYPTTLPLFSNGIDEEGLDGGIIYIIQANISSRQIDELAARNIKTFTIDDLLRKARQLDEGTFQYIVKDFAFFNAAERRRAEEELENDEDGDNRSSKGKKSAKKVKTKFEDVELTDKEREMMDILQGNGTKDPATERRKAFDRSFHNPFTRSSISTYFSADSYKMDDVEEEDIEIKEAKGQTSFFDTD